LEAFSLGVAREWGSRQIRSNSVVPGFMETEMSQKLTVEQREKIYNRTSLQSATDIDSVASTVWFLLSEESRSITGQSIFVDNGSR
jgi:3-oxoacyl-[acyl-carrier protein] reductase